MNSFPLIGLMLGDATGIGPEICAKVLASGVINDVARVAVIGDARVLEIGMRDAGVTVGYRPHKSLEEVRWPADAVPLVDLGNIDPARLARGEVSNESGRLCGETLTYMIEQALGGELDGICFAPLNKAALHSAAEPQPKRWLIRTSGGPRGPADLVEQTRCDRFSCQKNKLSGVCSTEAAGNFRMSTRCSRSSPLIPASSAR